MKKLLSISAVMALFLTCGGCSDDHDNEPRPISNEQKVVERLKSIETGDMSSNAYMNPNKYIQHNLTIEDGHAGFEKLMAMLPPGSARVNTVRVFEDDDYVVAHTDYDFFGPTIGFDIFRFENGLIVEHWDNLQPKPATNNPSGRSMVDGETKIADRDKTGENKALVSQFVEDILMRQNPSRLASYFNGNNYIQHNPQIGDGVTAFSTAFEQLVADGLVYERVHKILGEGNFVLVVSEGIYEGNPTSFYDLFRVANGRIAEHWDVVERIPPVSEWMNQNGKFNFPY